MEFWFNEFKQACLEKFVVTCGILLAVNHNLPVFFSPARLSLACATTGAAETVTGTLLFSAACCSFGSVC